MIRERKATDISVVMLVTLLTGLSLWIWYGMMRKDWPIVITNGFSLATNATMITLRYYYLRLGRK